MIWQLYFSCGQQKVNNGLLHQSEASFHFSLRQFWREWFKKGMGRRWETLKEDLDFPGGSVVRPANAEDVGLIPESEIPWRRKWQPAPVFLPGKSRDRGAWRATMSDTTEGLSTQARKEALASGLVERWRGIRYHGKHLGLSPPENGRGSQKKYVSQRAVWWNLGLKCIILSKLQKIEKPDHLSGIFFQYFVCKRKFTFDCKYVYSFPKCKFLLGNTENSQKTL